MMASAALRANQSLTCEEIMKNGCVYGLQKTPVTPEQARQIAANESLRENHHDFILELPNVEDDTPLGNIGDCGSEFVPEDIVQFAEKATSDPGDIIATALLEWTRRNSRHTSAALYYVLCDFGDIVGLADLALSVLAVVL